ncbi:MAG: heme exporter protein CcmB [Thermonemataceae bacterium]
MLLLGEIKGLIYKEIILEWRQKYAFNGLMLYIVGAIMIAYLSFSLHQNQLNPITWNALFWIILLFSAVNTIAKSFMQERANRLLYYYILASPQAIIIAKIIYNILLMLFISFVGIGGYSLVLGNPVQDLPMFVGNLLLGALGFSSTLTMVSGIAAKANNNVTLMAVLSFPILIPMLLLLIRVSKNALDGLDRTTSFNELVTLGAMNLIVIVISLLLFPLLWRS